MKQSESQTPLLPTHVGVIMDGNGRWAKKRGLPRNAGHRQGVQAFRKIVKHCKKLGIPYATFYVFSTENWKRPQAEVDSIMNLLREYLDEVRDYTAENTRVIFIGERGRLAEDIRAKMEELERDSADFTAMTLILALGYGGRAELTHAAQSLAQDVSEGKLMPSAITEEMLAERLYTGLCGIPDVDLVIRPSGEMRLSNFMIWQTAYAEYVFMDILWPDFRERDFDRALKEYTVRSRRFGGV